MNDVTKDLIYILPHTENDIYMIDPLHGKSLNYDDNSTPPMKCLGCGGMLYIEFTRSSLGLDSIISIPHPERLFPIARRSDVIVVSGEQSPSILFSGRKVTRREAYGSSIISTDEKNSFEISVADIKFGSAPKHICLLVCPVCDKDLGNLDEAIIRAVNFCSEGCAEEWKNRQQEEGDCK